MSALAPAVVMLDAAFSYAERDVPVFPVWWIVNGRCACGKVECDQPGKHPLGAVVPHGVLDATTDPEILRRRRTRYPHANIATPTSWATVLDVDPRHGGDDALAVLERDHGSLPETAEVLTGGGGRHVYFRPVAGLTPSASKVGVGLDIKTGPGAYVLLPPSSHVSGGTYLDEIMHPLFETPLAPMPAWLVTLASRPVAEGEGSNINGHQRSSEDWAQKLVGAPEGQRRAVALAIAGHFLGLRIAPAEVESILPGYSARCTPPFPEREARDLVRDLARRDRARPEVRPTREPAESAPHRTPWAAALPIAEFLATEEVDAQFLDDDRTLSPGALTELFSPRGLGKTLVLHAKLVEALDLCADCSCGTWVRYGAVALCFACAKAREAAR